MKKILRRLWLAGILVLIALAMTFTASAEAGGEFASAHRINVNEVYTDNISTKSDVDYFVFTLSSAGSVSIDFSRDNLFDAQEYWSAVIYDANSNFITDYSFLGNKTETSTHNVGLDAGTYFIRIRGGNWFEWSDGSGYSKRYSTVDYNFNVKYVKSNYWEKENNESYNTANVISLNKKYSASICENNDVDYYKFTLSSDGYIYLNFKRNNLYDAQEYWTIAIYDKNTNLITDYSFSGNSTENNTCKIGLATGTYFVRIRGGNWFEWSDGSGYSKRYSTVDYNFNVKYTKSNYWERENNESYSTASAISLNKKYSASICEDDDVDFYKFTLTEKTSLSLKFIENVTSDSQEYYTVALLDSNTNEIISFSIYGNTSTTKQSISLNKGTYYIRVRGGNWYDHTSYSRRYSTNDYSFCIEYIKPGRTSKIISSPTTSSIKLKWNKVSGATGYRIYIRLDGKWKKLKDITSTSYNIKDLKAGTKYKFAVRTYKIYSDDTILLSGYKTIETATKPKTPVLKVSSTVADKATFTWTNVSGESGYQVYYSTNKSSGFKKVKNYKANVTKGSKSKLKSGKKYYFKVRAYKKTDSGYVYSSWSQVKSVKIK